MQKYQDTNKFYYFAKRLLNTPLLWGAITFLEALPSTQPSFNENLKYPCHHWRIKAQKEQIRLEEERKLERVRHLAEAQQKLEERELLILERLKLEEEERVVEQRRRKREDKGKVAAR